VCTLQRIFIDSQLSASEIGAALWVDTASYVRRLECQIHKHNSNTENKPYVHLLTCYFCSQIRFRFWREIAFEDSDRPNTTCTERRGKTRVRDVGVDDRDGLWGPIPKVPNSERNIFRPPWVRLSDSFPRYFRGTDRNFEPANFQLNSSCHFIGQVGPYLCVNRVLCDGSRCSILLMKYPVQTE
jgi:hypothetical protein